jgi:hypothetical protein
LDDELRVFEFPGVGKKVEPDASDDTILRDGDRMSYEEEDACHIRRRMHVI